MKDDGRWLVGVLGALFVGVRSVQGLRRDQEKVDAMRRRYYGRGSEVRTGLPAVQVGRYAQVTFASGDEANANSDDLEELLSEIDGVSDVEISFTDYNEGTNDTIHASFLASPDLVMGIEFAVDNWVGSREGAFWPGDLGEET